MQKRYNAYFKMWQVDEMYERLKGDRKGISSFMKKAKEVAIFNIEKNCYEFRNEEALWRVFEERFTLILQKKNITDWGHLMQYIS